MQVNGLRDLIAATIGSLDLGDVARWWHLRIEQGSHGFEIVAGVTCVDSARHRPRGVPQRALHGLDVRPLPRLPRMRRCVFGHAGPRSTRETRIAVSSPNLIPVYARTQILDGHGSHGRNRDIVAGAEKQPLSV